MLRLILALSLFWIPLANGQTVIYESDFESPNQPAQRTCGFAVDQTGINELYGTAEYQFHQQFTVEAVLISDPIYTDSLGTGGNLALGMLSNQQDDKLALTFDAESYNFINVSMDVSSIDVSRCGGPFGIDVPIFKLTLFDSPGGAFVFDSGIVLDEAEIVGGIGPDPFTFNWVRGSASLDADGATDGMVTLVWDLMQSGYGAFDNLMIEASNVSVANEKELDPTPDGFVLSEVYPNPFNPQARFTLRLDELQYVRISVYDMLGRHMSSIHEGALSSGEHAFEIDGAGLNSGVYLLHVASDRFLSTQKVVLHK